MITKPRAKTKSHEKTDDRTTRSSATPGNSQQGTSMAGSAWRKVPAMTENLVPACGPATWWSFRPLRERIATLRSGGGGGPEGGNPILYLEGVEPSKVLPWSAWISGTKLGFNSDHPARGAGGGGEEAPRSGRSICSRMAARNFNSVRILPRPAAALPTPWNAALFRPDPGRAESVP